MSNTNQTGFNFRQRFPYRYLRSDIHRIGDTFIVGILIRTLND